jgi:hypothetical protein
MPVKLIPTSKQAKIVDKVGDLKTDIIPIPNNALISLQIKVVISEVFIVKLNKSLYC